RTTGTSSSRRSPTRSAAAVSTRARPSRMRAPCSTRCAASWRPTRSSCGTDHTVEALRGGEPPRPAVWFSWFRSAGSARVEALDRLQELLGAQLSVVVGVERREVARRLGPGHTQEVGRAQELVLADGAAVVAVEDVEEGLADLPLARTARGTECGRGAGGHVLVSGQGPVVVGVAEREERRPLGLVGPHQGLGLGGVLRNVEGGEEFAWCTEE